MNKVFGCFLLFFFLLTGSAFTGKARRYTIKTVVIDAGHGGHDTGCLGSSGREKDIALDISLKLGKLIHENFPDVKVVYTRKSDIFVELRERAAIANRHKADLFICIHANSGNGGAYGTETFVLGLHRAEENLAVSRRENSAILFEKDYKTNYDGFDPNSPEANIIFRLYQNTYLQQSLLFASKVQDHLNDYAGRFNRGVKQAGLLVLARTSMPGVLIETGFLTNREEEKYLLSGKGQNQIATSIYRAFKEYKLDMEETPDKPKSSEITVSKVQPPESNQIKDTSYTDNKTETAQKPVSSTEKNQKEKGKEEAVNLMEPLPGTEVDSPPGSKINTRNDPEISRELKDTVTEKIQVTIKGQPEKEAKKEAWPPPSEKKEIKEVAVNSSSAREVFFTIQLAAVQDASARDRERFKKVDGIMERVAEDGVSRFTAGTYFSLDKAILGQAEWRNKGFKDAFVTAYHKNKRITIKEASGLMK